LPVIRTEDVRIDAVPHAALIDISH